MKKKPVIYAVTNQKGGIGKTTTATCMAFILSNMGKRVLLVDTDVQCNSTDLFRAVIEDRATLYDLLLDDDPCTVDEAIQHTEYGDIIPSDFKIQGADWKLTKKEDFLLLRKALHGIEGYDYIIIDTNPSVNSMLYNALAAADEIIIPVTAGRFAITGLSHLTETIMRVKRTLNPDLRIAGLLMVAYRTNTNFHKDLREKLREVAPAIGTKLFDSCIRDSVKVGESQADRVPLIKYAKRSNPEKDYEAFVKELIAEV